MDYLKSLNELKKEHQSYHSSKLRELYDMWYSETFGEEELSDEYKLNLWKLQIDFITWVIETNPNNVVTKTLSGWKIGILVCDKNSVNSINFKNSDWTRDTSIFTGDLTYHIPYKYHRLNYYTIFTVEHWPELIPFSILNL